MFHKPISWLLGSDIRGGLKVVVQHMDIDHEGQSGPAFPDLPAFRCLAFLQHGWPPVIAMVRSASRKILQCGNFAAGSEVARHPHPDLREARLHRAALTSPIAAASSPPAA